MDDFKAYLSDLGIVKKNQTRMSNLLKNWLSWSIELVEDRTYKDLMNYIEYLQKSEKSIHHINRSLQTISHYYEYKKLPNIALNVRLKGVLKRSMSLPLKSEELKKVYELFEVKGQHYFKYSDRIILGLMIYQGLEMGDFMKLELKDVDLKRGKIYIPERGIRNSRTLALASHQILDLHTYISKYRASGSEKLLSPQGTDYHQLHWQFKRLSKAVKALGKAQLNLNITKLSHLRQSRISIWVKKEGIRKAQYLAGFRRVLSAERYRKADLTKLKESLKKHHPMN